MADILEICKLDPRATVLKMAEPKIRKAHVLEMLSVILDFFWGGGGGGGVHGVHGDLFLRLD